MFATSVGISGLLSFFTSPINFSILLSFDVSHVISPLFDAVKGIKDVISTTTKSIRDVVTGKKIEGSTPRYHYINPLGVTNDPR